jgi:anti-sigma factor RsiW
MSVRNEPESPGPAVSGTGTTIAGDTTFTIQTDGSILVERAGASWWQFDRQSALHALVRDHAKLQQQLEAHREMLQWLSEHGSWSVSVLHNGELVAMNETTGNWFRESSVEELVATMKGQQ